MRKFLTVLPPAHWCLGTSIYLTVLPPSHWCLGQQQALEIPLDLKPSKSLAPEQNLEPSLPLSPPVVLQYLGPITSQRFASLSPPFQHPSHQHAAKKCHCLFCVSLPLEGRERKRKAVVINNDPVHTVDGDRNGDAKMAQTRPVKKQRSEPADANPRTKRAKEPSRKKKEVRVEVTTKVTSRSEKQCS